MEVHVAQCPATAADVLLVHPHAHYNSKTAEIEIWVTSLTTVLREGLNHAEQLLKIGVMILLNFNDEIIA